MSSSDGNWDWDEDRAAAAVQAARLRGGLALLTAAGVVAWAIVEARSLHQRPPYLAAFALVFLAAVSGAKVPDPFYLSRFLLPNYDLQGAVETLPKAKREYVVAPGREIIRWVGAAVGVTLALVPAAQLEAFRRGDASWPATFGLLALVMGFALAGWYANRLMAQPARALGAALPGESKPGDT